MSDLATSPPSSSDGSPPTPISEESPPSNSSPAPPAGGKDESPPTPSTDTHPPPPDSSSSSPPPVPETPSTNAPPPPDSSSSSPPPPPEAPSGSNSPLPLSPPPPSSTNTSPPTPPTASNSSQPLPPSPPDSSVHHPPPVAPKYSPLPPPDTPKNSPPPPAGSSPPVVVSPPVPSTPPIAIPSPPLPISPPASTANPTPSSGVTPSIPTTATPPIPQAPTNVPNLSPPSTNSDHGSPISLSKSSGDSSSGPIAGVTIAGVVIISLIATYFMISRKRKKKAEAFRAQYGSSPPNFPGKSGGYYNSQQQTTWNFGQSDGYNSAKPPAAPSSMGNSYGNYLGSGTPDPSVIGGAKLWFSYEELMEITNGFSRQNVLGEGGFGCVYKGWLPDGRVVAVKELRAGSGQGEREFRAEVDIISRVHHRHLVSLVGYCIAEHHRLLVYEFVPNNNLEQHLHGKGMPVMDWSKRVKIAIGAARGLAYLHEDCHPKIIHRDIKSANILVDDAFEAKVADFGLAKLTNEANTHVSTRVMGTFGYMAPEYASSGKLTDRSDVFSFGVVLLELVTGRKSIDKTQPLGDESLVEWARPLLIHTIDTGHFGDLPDPRLGKRYVESEMFRMIEAAAACVRHSASKRPRMVQLVRALDTIGNAPDLTNGVKVGQSTVYNSGQYSADIQQFRMMVFGTSDSSEYEMSGGEFNYREAPHKPPSS